ncbi:MAG: ORF6N domain-containing protein [Bacteroidota bacterium]|nr:ORF6N domain-containing protein [Bacteroidota bacterium]
MTKPGSIIPVESIQQRIFEIRKLKIIVDTDLANFYGVETKRLNEQVKRNPDRFPEDFIFQLTENEKAELVANCDHLTKLKYSSSLPYAFTEHGAIMAASVLNTKRAAEVSVFIVRAFVALRQSVLEYKEIIQRLTDLENKTSTQDKDITAIIQAIRQLAEPEPVPKDRRIGF